MVQFWWFKQPAYWLASFKAFMDSETLPIMLNGFPKIN